MVFLGPQATASRQSNKKGVAAFFMPAKVVPSFEKAGRQHCMALVVKKE
jgi:hypothetical protein